MLPNHGVSLMKKFRKLIGVILSQPDYPYQHKLLSGIISRAFKLNYDVAVFSSFVKDELSKEWHYGESNIFNMINYSALDGIIFVPDTLRVNGVDKKIEQDILKNFKKPVISVDIKNENFHNIFTDDIQSIKKIISHLIEKHKLTDIAFMTGIKGHPHSTNRLTGYYEALVEHDIPIDQTRVFYGDFWYDKGEEVVQALMDDPRPMPQAIACACDTMAISVCEALKAHGFKVPEDVAVTGYDSIEAGINYIPCITSCELPSDTTGKRAVSLLHSLLTDTKFVDEKSDTDIICGKSCGCPNDAAEDIRQKYKTWRDNDYFGEFNSAYNFMLEALISEKDLEKYMAALAWYTYMIGNSCSFYLCLCENWDNAGETEQDQNYLRNGYTKKMTLPLRKMGDEKRVNPELEFDLSEMLPTLFDRRPKPKAFFFSPVNFNDRCFGYAVYSDDEKNCYPACYCQWMRYVSTSLESLRRQRNLMYMYKKMEDNAVTDLLTGIFNRNGFNMYSEKIFSTVKENGGCLSIIIGDLNNLKYINDTFGHSEGDFAIKTAADAFRKACTGDMLCYRIGGDEYVILSGSMASADKITEAENIINEHLHNVNNAANKPYSVSISMGAFFGPITEYDSIEQPFNLADSRMFTAKEKFKKEEGFYYRKSKITE